MLKYYWHRLMCKLGRHRWAYELGDRSVGLDSYYFCARLEDWGVDCGTKFNQKHYDKYWETALKRQKAGKI